MSTQLAACPSTATWRAFVAGELSPAEVERLQTHLDVCSGCLALFDSLDARLPEELLADLRAALAGAPADGALADTQPTAQAGTDGVPAGRESGAAGADELPPGTTIGPYRVLRTLGTGGMGCVVAAEHVVLRRLVAIKLPFARLAGSAEGRARFLREARAAGKLQHENVCTVHEAGEWNGRPFLVMSYVAGQTLSAWAKAGPLAPQTAARIVADVACGAAHAHAGGVVHRDIKPSNVMIEDGTQRVVLTDFGLARDSANLDVSLTASGQVMGTPSYMAPEQAAGDHAAVGPTTDVYALGAVLYELLSGRPPFVGGFSEVLRAVQFDDPPALQRLRPEVPRGLQTICARAMKKAPRERYPGAQALAEDLQRFLQGEAIWARPDAWWEKAARHWRRRRKAFAAAAALVTICLAVVAAFAWSASTQRRVNRLAQTVARELQSPEWNAERLTQLESLCRELHELDPQQSQANPQVIADALAAHLRREYLARPRLDAALVREAEDLLALLAPRDAAAAEAIGTLLRQRESAWQPVWQFGPFEPADAARFQTETQPPAAAQAAAGRLVPPPNGSGVAFGPDLDRRNVRLRATFVNRFRRGDAVGFVLAAGESRYVFRCVPRPEFGTPETAAEFGGLDWQAAELAIERDGTVLDSRILSAAGSAQAGDDLRIEVSLADRRLTLQIEDLPPLEFTDLFDLAAGQDSLRPGVLWPPDAAVLRVSAENQSLAPAPSALERGDALFARGEWQAAVEEYERQRLAGSPDAQQVDELELKRALCLAALERSDAAIAALEPLVRSSDDLVRRAATFQLWLLLVRQEQFERAGVLFASWDADDLHQLSRLIPQAARREILDRVYGRQTGAELLFVASAELEALRRAQTMLALEWDGAQEQCMRILQLARAFHAAGAYDEGLRLLRPYIDAPPSQYQKTNVDLCEEYLWMLRSQGERQQAANLLESRLGLPPDHWPQWKRLLLERAHLHAAEQDWPAALADVEAYLREPSALERYFYYSTAHLMRGFCLRRLGRPEEAEAAWQEATCSRWRAAAQIRSADLLLTGMPLENALLSSMLAGELDADELALWVEASGVGRQIPGLAFAVRQFGQKLIPFVLRVKSDPVALESLERTVFQQVSLAEYLREPFGAVGLEVFRSAAQAPTWTNEERRAIRQFFFDGVDAFGRGEIQFGHFVQALAAWEGASGELGWEGLVRNVPSRLRGGTALLLGCRQFALGNPAAARELLQTAVNDLPHEDALCGLAQRELAAALAAPAVAP